MYDPQLFKQVWGRVNEIEHKGIVLQDLMDDDDVVVTQLVPLEVGTNSPNQPFVLLSFIPELTEFDQIY